MTMLSARVLASAVAAVACPSYAQSAKPEDAIRYRQRAMFWMQKNFGRISAMATDSAASLNSSAGCHDAVSKE